MHLLTGVIRVKAYFCTIQTAKMKRLVFIGFSSLMISCNNGSNDHTDGTTRPPEPESLTCTLQKAYPHDTSSFTEGLLIYKGSLYESTGDPEYIGKSKLMKIDLNSGKVDKQVNLDKKYFGEGIVIFRDTIYQLTYKEHTAFVYSLDFKKVKE